MVRFTLIILLYRNHFLTLWFTTKFRKIMSEIQLALSESKKCSLIITFNIKPQNRFISEG